MLEKLFTLVLLTVFITSNAYADLIIPATGEQFFMGLYGSHGRLSLLIMLLGVAIVLIVGGYKRKK